MSLSKSQLARKPIEIILGRTLASRMATPYHRATLAREELSRRHWQTQQRGYSAKTGRDASGGQANDPIQQSGKPTVGRLAPLMPLLLMVVGGVSLALYTVTRQVTSPAIMIDKDRRQTLVELENPEGQKKAGEDWAENDPLRKLSHRGESGVAKAIQEHTMTPFVNSTLPGDYDAVVGEKGGKGKGKPLGGGYGG